MSTRTALKSNAAMFASFS